MRILGVLATLLFFTGTIYSATIYVPDDYATIQEAIDGSVNGDTVIVRPGTYVENISFEGMAITVLSEQGSALTTIDGNQTGSVVTFERSEQSDSVLDGFTITNGTGTFDGSYEYHGGGIYIKYSSPTITNCIIDNNQADMGGGVYCHQSSPNILKNTISNNTSEEEGAGIYCSNSWSPTIMGNLIIENKTSWATHLTSPHSRIEKLKLKKN